MWIPAVKPIRCGEIQKIRVRCRSVWWRDQIRSQISLIAVSDTAECCWALFGVCETVGLRQDNWGLSISTRTHSGFSPWQRLLCMWALCWWLSGWLAVVAVRVVLSQAPGRLALCVYIPLVLSPFSFSSCLFSYIHFLILFLSKRLGSELNTCLIHILLCYLLLFFILLCKVCKIVCSIQFYHIKL